MQAPPSAATILLVEDNLGDAELVETLLEADGDDYQVLHVTRLAEAAPVLDAGRCDAVLLDLGLPDSEGLDTLQQLQAWTSAIPMLVVTGSGDEMLRRQALALGAVDWVDKDELGGGRLTRSVELALARHRLEGELVRLQQFAEDERARVLASIVDTDEPTLALSASGHVLFANDAAGAMLCTDPRRLEGRRLPSAVATAPVDASEIRFHSTRVRWGTRTAWLVALRPASLAGEEDAQTSTSEPAESPPGPGPDPTTEAPIEPGFAGDASEVCALVRRLATDLDASQMCLDRALELVRDPETPEVPAERRAVLVELLEAARRTVGRATTELVTVDELTTEMMLSSTRAARRGGPLGDDA